MIISQPVLTYASRSYCYSAFKIWQKCIHLSINLFIFVSKKVNKFLEKKSLKIKVFIFKQSTMDDYRLRLHLLQVNKKKPNLFLLRKVS